MLFFIKIICFSFFLLLSFVTTTMIDINNDTIKRSYKVVMEARNNMLHCREGKFYPKVCCLCDRFIPWDKEQSISLQRDLQHSAVERFFNKDSLKWEYITGCEKIQNLLKRIYTVPHTTARDPYHQLQKYFLSPRSYVYKKKYKEE